MPVASLMSPVNIKIQIAVVRIDMTLHAKTFLSRLFFKLSNVCNLTQMQGTLLCFDSNIPATKIW